MFKKSETIRSSGREIYSNILKLDEPFQEQINLSNEIDKCK